MDENGVYMTDEIYEAHQDARQRLIGRCTRAEKENDVLKEECAEWELDLNSAITYLRSVEKRAKIDRNSDFLRQQYTILHTALCDIMCRAVEQRPGSLNDYLVGYMTAWNEARLIAGEALAKMRIEHEAIQRERIGK
ncbi:MAG TPA: hypothetical protein VM118_09020 [Acidobacteriota bacterium]|nr:hypothetical protein [Acidobacteriota bacterium]